MLAAVCLMLLGAAGAAQAQNAAPPGSNPVIRDKFTADPAPLVAGDRLYLYVGHDEAQRDEMFTMRDATGISSCTMPR
ncbi:hypothetical protein ACG3SL_18340 [Sphingomonas sp. CJ20]